MKQFFFFLVFLNVIYFFWGVTAGNTKVMMTHQVPLYKESELEALVLIPKEEVAVMLERNAVLESKAEKLAVQPVNECYLVGNFVDESDAKELSKKLSSLVSGVSVVPSEVFEEFWVVYPSSGDWNRSLLNAEQLKANGVTDLWLVPNGPYKGVISLGLFLTAESADKRLKELSDKLVEADVISRKKNRYGVKLVTDGGIESIQNYLDRLKTGKKISMRKIAC